MAVENPTLSLSWDVLDGCNGFSIDMGDSLLKLIYIDKKEWLEPGKRETNSEGKLHLKTFTHDEFKNGTVYKFMREHVLIKSGKDNKPPIIHGTGFGVTRNGKAISKELGVSIHCVPDVHAFVTAMNYSIKHLPREELIVKLPEENIKVTKSLMEMTLKGYERSEDTMVMLKVARTKNLTIDPHFELGPGSEPFGNEQDIYPYMVVTCGSCAESICVYKDGTYKITSKSRRGGKTWLGIGSLLSGAENYESLMKLTQNGSVADVDFTYTDFASPDTETKLDDADDPYQRNHDIIESVAKSEPITAFTFGKTVDKTIDDFKKEDLAKSFLMALTSDVVSQVLVPASEHKIKHIFFTGGLVNDPLVRRSIYLRLMLTGFVQRYLRANITPIQCHFVKEGQYYGALGALLNHKF